MEFYAYFWNDDVYIHGRYKYSTNEILTRYLNTNFNRNSQFEEALRDLKFLKEQLILKDDMSYDNLKSYNRYVQRASNYFDFINSKLEKLPPYNRILKQPYETIQDVLNRYSVFFEDGFEDGIDYADIGWDTVNKYGSGYINSNGYREFILHYFEPDIEQDWERYDIDTLDSLNELNDAIVAFFDEYIRFIESYLTVSEVFKPFVENFLHQKSTFPNEFEIAKFYDEFNKSNSNKFEKIKCEMKSFGYKVIDGDNKKPILCEQVLFADIQSFLFYDFFYGLKRNYLPNKCKHCGKFFLIKGGKYFSYCDRKIKGEPDKTCRDVGAKRQYIDKCKNDPIWQTYNRAYKAHYARYMKKKMTVAEFEEWSSFASRLRDKAINGEVEFEDYYTRIRK